MRWILSVSYTHLAGYMQRYTGIKTIGLCHSVQVCRKALFKELKMEDYLEGGKELIAGINHMAWLLECKDKDGNDLYPMIKERARQRIFEEDCKDRVRPVSYTHLVTSCRSGKQDSTSDAMDMFKRMPRFLAKALINIICVLDRHGKVPRSLIETDPYYSSIVLTNLGSVSYTHLLLFIIPHNSKCHFLNGNRRQPPPCLPKSETDGRCQWRRSRSS